MINRIRSWWNKPVPLPVGSNPFPPPYPKPPPPPPPPDYVPVQPPRRSPYRRFQYRSNTMYRLRKKLGRRYGYAGRYKIHQGFHAYITEECAKNHKRSSFERLKIRKCAIPRGAKYFVGTAGDIVSTSIRTGDL